METILNFFGWDVYPKTIITLSIVNIPLYFYMGKLFFSDWQGFLETLRFFYQPIWLSALRGEGYEDFGQSLKLLWFLLSSLCLIQLQFKLITYFY